jgi:protein phosphatase 1 regulatory subunit 37
MCRDILSTCVRNTEDAEKAATNGSSSDATLGKKAAMWGMIEESELARTIRGSLDKVCRHRLVHGGPGIAKTLIPSHNPQSGKKTHSSFKSVG